jgi:hypothetical protein
MKKYLFLFLLIAMSLQSCYYIAKKIFKDNQADEATKNQIAAMNKTLFTSLANNDMKGVKSLMSNRLILKLDSTFDLLVRSVNEAYGKDAEYEVMDEFYTKNDNSEVSTTVSSPKGGGYKINYIALNEETYVSVLVTKNAPINCVILAIYGKYDDKWKLNILELANYSAFDKNTPDYYNEALNEYKEGNLIDAADNIIIAKSLATPLDKYLVYDNNTEMKAFHDKVLDEANKKYKLPFTIKFIKQQPQIFSISPQVIIKDKHPGVYPMVRYKSTIPLTDTVALRKENIDIQKIIGTLYKGIDKHKNYILYMAYNNIPDDKILADRYGFVQTLGK